MFGDAGVMRGEGVKKLQKTQPCERHSRERQKAICCVLHRVSQVCVYCQALAACFKGNSTLTTLILVYNKIGDEGAKAWCLVRMGS